jgi:hypothetical protein
MKALLDALTLRVLIHLYRWCQLHLHAHDPHTRHVIDWLGLRIYRMLG